jgi:uncharacterized membrane protein YdfJ with MMPL/SSD domain
MAFALALGVLIDAFVVRSLLVPALLSLFGYTSGWPGHRLTRDTPTITVRGPTPRIEPGLAAPVDQPSRPRRWRPKS